MSTASIARQRARITAKAVPREGQTIEEAQRDALMVHEVLNATATAVIAECRLFFGNDDMKFVRQNGRYFLMVKAVSGKGATNWRQLSAGPTPVEAFAQARVAAENHQRAGDAKKAAEAAAHPQPVEQPV